MRSNDNEFGTSEWHAAEAANEMRGLAQHHEARANELREFADLIDTELASGSDFRQTMFAENVTRYVTEGLLLRTEAARTAQSALRSAWAAVLP
jgi:hypothetical protein